MASLHFKTRITPECKKDSKDIAVKQHTSNETCPVELFQVSAKQRNPEKQSSRMTKVQMQFDGSGDNTINGNHTCPTNLFLTKSCKKDSNIDLLYRRKEVDENFKLVLQTKELNRLSKDGRINWLIEAVGGNQTITQEAKNSELIACSSKRGQGCFHGITKRLGHAITSIRKLLRRGRVDVLPQKHS